MTNTYLQIIQNFWANHYDNIEGADILKMSTFLFKFSDKLKKLNEDLKQAIKEERYEEAAKIRDEIKSMNKE